MKMAKASKADLDMAMELANFLENIEKGYVPQQMAENPEAEGLEFFDECDGDQCIKAIESLKAIVCKGSLFRVVFGMAVVCDPQNRLLDPVADTLAHHPDHARALETIDGMLKAARRVYDDVGTPGDFGYESKPGKALKNLYDQYNAALKLQAPAPVATPTVVLPPCTCLTSQVGPSMCERHAP